MSDPSDTSRPTSFPFALLFVALLAFLTYANTLDARYAWDDVSSFLFHEHVQDPSKLGQLFQEDQHAFGRGQGNFYRPLVAATFMLDYVLSADSIVAPEEPAPLVFHLSSAFWHALATVSLFVLLARLAAPSVASLATASIYAVHPMHTEAVAYVSGRADSMSAAFMFLGLVFALSRTTGRGRVLTVVASFVCYAAALTSKESSFIYPVLLMLCLAASPRENETSFSRYTPLAGGVAMLAAYGVLRTTVLNFAAPGGGGEITPLAQRLIETLQSFAHYLGMLFYPTNLHMERTLEGATSASIVVGGILLVACIGFIVVSAALGMRRAAVGMAWFLVTWLPISGIFPLNAPMAEHWMYVPMAGFWWALCEYLPRAEHPLRLLQRPAALYPIGAAGAAWVLLLLSISAERNLEWRTSEEIFRATLRENPDTTRVHFNLALVYEGPLDNAPGGRRHYQEMLARFSERRAVGLQSGYRDEEGEALLSLGNIAYLERDLGEAGWYYSEVLEKIPARTTTASTRARAAFQLGRMYLSGGNRELGAQYLELAANSDPFLAPEISQLLQGR